MFHLLNMGFLFPRNIPSDAGKKGFLDPDRSCPPEHKTFPFREEQVWIEKIVDNHLKAIYYGASIGVNLRVGTDSGSKGVRPGKSYFKELQLFKQAGLSLDQIIAAACLGREEMEKGNYLLVEKNFIEMEKVEALYINGREWDCGYIPLSNPVAEKLKKGGHEKTKS